jgi:hypothetical protein
MLFLHKYSNRTVQQPVYSKEQDGSDRTTWKWTHKSPKTEDDLQACEVLKYQFKAVCDPEEWHMQLLELHLVLPPYDEVQTQQSHLPHHTNNC